MNYAGIENCILLEAEIRYNQVQNGQKPRAHSTEKVMSCNC